jgi:hypothetical protein
MSDMDSGGTGTAVAGQLPLRETSPATIGEVLNDCSVLRDETTQLAGEVHGLHHRARQGKLDELTATFALREPLELLDALSERGLSWALIAKLIRVSPTAVRKWRRGAPITPENRRSLARLLGFLELAAEAMSPTADPAAWLEVRISDEATLTPADLYRHGSLDLLLDYASQRLAPQEILDGFDPGWRERYRPDDRFMVVEAEDGMPAIVERD